MFHGWMFDPDGDQAAADSTRSSTSLDTGASVNPRTDRRLVTASYTSIFSVVVLIQVSSSNSSEPEMFCGSDLFSSCEQRIRSLIKTCSPSTSDQYVSPPR